MSSKLLMVAAVVVMGVACGTKHESNYYPEIPAPIPLNAPADIIGSWKQDTGAVYSFNADGSYELNTGVNGVIFKGQYVAGSNNELDISVPSYGTVYRVFSVKDDALRITNTVNAGADADHRDHNLDADTTLHLTRVSN